MCLRGGRAQVARLLERDQVSWPAAGVDPSTVSRSSMRCLSRFLRSDASRGAKGILRVVRLLLDHGADVNAHLTGSSRKADAGVNQGPLYGAAGIANNPELTRMLLAAGRRRGREDPKEDPGTEVKGWVIWPRGALPRLGVRRRHLSAPAPGGEPAAAIPSGSRTAWPGCSISRTRMASSCISGTAPIRTSVFPGCTIAPICIGPSCTARSLSIVRPSGGGGRRSRTQGTIWG